MRKRIVGLVAGVLIAASGCADDAETPEVGGDTVIVSKVDLLYSTYPSIAQFVHESPIVVVGTLAETRDIAQEVPADPDGGADLYGTITFRVASVLRGTAGPTVTVYYESGKRDGSDPKRRIAYTYDGLYALQQPSGALRGAAEFAGRSFVLFLTAGPGNHPVLSKGHVMAHPLGIALLGADGALRFGDGTGSPVAGADDKPVSITLAELTAAAG